VEIREQTLRGEVVFNESEWTLVPTALRETIAIALAANPDKRFQDVAAMAKAIAPLLPPSLPLLSSPLSIRPPLANIGRRESLAASVVSDARGMARLTRRTRSGWAAASAILAVIGLGTLLRPRTLPRGPSPVGMARLSGGSYVMGSDETAIAGRCAAYTHGCPPEVRNEIPPRSVAVAPFELDIHEVTNDEFAKFLTTIAASTRLIHDPDVGYARYLHYYLRAGDDFLLYDLWEPKRGIEVSQTGTFQARLGFEKLPVTLVTWLGARLFCKSLNKRLPTEAEWELAAGGIEKRPFPWGFALPTCRGVHIPGDGTLIVDGAEYCENARAIPFPIMTAEQDTTPEGIHDLAGNVAEWVDDDEGMNSDDMAYVGRLKSETPAIVRGGAYSSSFLARATSRVFRLPFNAAGNLGFRCAQSIPTQ
jgi:formylglycine-generating enzyme required for sulfatase activity